jgi:hypothetical protein
MCLQATGLGNGAAVNTAPCGSYGTGYYSWDLIDLGGSNYKIVHRGSGRCLTVPTWNGNHAILYDCGVWNDQVWSATTYDGSWQTLPFGAWFEQKSSHQCLVAPYWNNYQPTVYDCAYYIGHADDWVDQRWWVF